MVGESIEFLYIRWPIASSKVIARGGRTPVSKRSDSEWLQSLSARWRFADYCLIIYKHRFPTCCNQSESVCTDEPDSSVMRHIEVVELTQLVANFFFPVIFLIFLKSRQTKGFLQLHHYLWKNIWIFVLNLILAQMLAITKLSQTDCINCHFDPIQLQTDSRLIAGCFEDRNCEWLPTWCPSLRQPFQRQSKCRSIAQGHNNFGPAMVSNHCFPQCYCSIKYNDCHSFKSFLSWLLWGFLACFRQEIKFSWNILLTNLCTLTQKNLTIYVHEHEKPAAFLWLFHMFLWDLVAQ